MATPAWQPYSLPRDKLESSRLNEQHQVYVKTTQYLLHPTIVASLPPVAHIAEIGTGTGAWLRDLASSTVPTDSWSFTGFDISDAQFPQENQGRCTFKVLNILDPVPEHLKGQFDAVHLRLLVCGLTGDDWTTTAKHVFQLLKPGGWIQWHESDFSRMNVLQLNPGALADNTTRILEFVVATEMKNGKLLDDVRRLLQTVRGAGFQACHQDVFSSDRLPENRIPGTQVGHGAVHSLLKIMAQRDPAVAAVVKDEMEELFQRSQHEVASGNIYYRWDMHVVIGRRPANES